VTGNHPAPPLERQNQRERGGYLVVDPLKVRGGRSTQGFAVYPHTCAGHWKISGSYCYRQFLLIR
jgi:hypothetical protein